MKKLITVALLIFAAPALADNVNDASTFWAVRLIPLDGTRLTSRSCGMGRVCLWIDVSDGHLKLHHADGTQYDISDIAAPTFTGSLSSTQIAFASGSNVIAGNSGLTWDGTHLVLGAGKSIQISDATTMSTAAVTGVLPTDVTFSPVGAIQNMDILASRGGTAGGAQTNASEFYVTKSGLSAVGIKFYWLPATSRTIKCSLWQTSSTTRLANATTSTTGTGTYTCSFGAQSLTAFQRYRVSFWDQSNTDYSYMTGPTVPAMPTLGGPYLMWNSWGNYSGTDTFPNSNAVSERYPVEPVLQ